MFEGSGAPQSIKGGRFPPLNHTQNAMSNSSLNSTFQLSRHGSALSRLRGSTNSKRSSRKQGIFWILTIPFQHFVPYLPVGVSWIRGQLERGRGGESSTDEASTFEEGYLHWQFVIALSEKGSLRTVRGIFGKFHAELTYSEAARDYVWKELTAVEGTRFELGIKPINRSVRIEWESVWEAATRGDVMRIPPSIRVQNYRTLRAIASDYAQPNPIVRRAFVYWGVSGSGKSKLAWEQAGMDAYPKDPRTKFWCGYRGQRNVVIDEFRGGIDIAHFLRWLDRYPVIVEVKGSSAVLQTESFWITSNLDPRDWYPELDEATRAALLRRLEITHFDSFP